MLLQPFAQVLPFSRDGAVRWQPAEHAAANHVLRTGASNSAVPNTLDPLLCALSLLRWEVQ